MGPCRLQNSNLQRKSSCAYLEAKTSQIYGKKALPKADFKVRENLYRLILGICMQGFACLYFTNMSVQCNATSTSDICLDVCPLPSSSLSFMYYIVYIAPFSLSIAKDYRGVSSTSFKFISTSHRKLCMLQGRLLYLIP